MNKRLTIRSLAAALAAILPAESMAQADTARASGPWTLQQCVDYAMENNIDVKSGSLSLEEAQQQTYATRGQLVPSLSFSTGHQLGWRPWSQSTVALSGGTMTSTQSDRTYSGNYNLSANWTVWDGGKPRLNIASSRLDEAAAEAQNIATANNIEEQIVQYYVQILYQTEAVSVADSTWRTSVALRDRGREMLAAGSLSRADLAQLEAQASQDEYSLVSATTQLATYKMQLKQILEIIRTQDFDVATPDIADDKVLEPLPAVDDVFAAAMASRPEARQSQISIEQAEIQQCVARAGHYPQINLSAGVSTSHNSASDDNIGQQMKQNVNNSIGLSINIPILDNRQTRTSISKAKIQRDIADLDSRLTETEIYKQVETYWLAALSAQAQYQSATVSAQSSAESLDLVSEQFKLGIKNIAELMTGKSNLLSARQQLLQSKYTALLNIALLKFYAGEPLTL